MDGWPFSERPREAGSVEGRRLPPRIARCYSARAMRRVTPWILSVVATMGWAKHSAGELAIDAQQPVNGPSCVNEIEEVPNERRVHIPEDQTPVYNHNPPVSGEHYEIWGRWQIHTDPLPRGYYVHNLEHGGVVFLYRSDAPQEIIDALVRIYNALPNDDSGEPACDHPRAVLTADDLLDAPWAVTVSGPEFSEEDLGVGYVIKSDCIASEQDLIDFAVQYRNHSVESLCDEGSVPP